MFPTIKKNRAGFSLIELITATFITMFVLLGAWSIYTMGWSWWHEMAPRVQAQQIARIAILSITEGTVDATAGTDTIGTATYQRRNGISMACYDPVISSSISANDRIDFGLETDGGNVRAFYLGLDPVTGGTAVFYRDNTGNTHMLIATRCPHRPPELDLDLDLNFEKRIDVVTGKIFIIVTATVTGDVSGTRSAPYHIAIEYERVVYIRNI
jgi:Prokaryotic N-terminal methylation motif